MLEMLVRSHQERAALTERMADRALAESRSGLAKQLRGRLQDYRNDAEILRQVQQRIGTASGLAPAPVAVNDTASASQARNDASSTK